MLFSKSTFTSHPGGEGRNLRSWRPRPAVVCAIPQNTVAIRFTSGDNTKPLRVSGKGYRNVGEFTCVFINLQRNENDTVLVYSETE